MRLFDRPTIGDEVWVELEELLIAADVGINTTEKLIGKVKERVSSERINQGQLVRVALKVEMTNLLKSTPQETARLRLHSLLGRCR